MRHNVEFTDGHMLVSLKEGTFLIDTGSPDSFSRSGELTFSDDVTPVPRSAMGAMDADELSEYINFPVDGIVGMDLMARHLVVFDGAEILLDDSAPQASGFQVIGTKCFIGIPVITVEVAGKSVRMFADTGAKISYLDEDLLSGHAIEETAQDFYPGFGRFPVDISTVSCSIAGTPIMARFGRLPPRLGMALMQGGVHGIMGRDLFDNFRVRLEKGSVLVSIARK